MSNEQNDDSSQPSFDVSLADNEDQEGRVILTAGIQDEMNAQDQNWRSLQSAEARLFDVQQSGIRGLAEEAQQQTAQSGAQLPPLDDSAATDGSTAIDSHDSHDSVMSPTSAHSDDETTSHDYNDSTDDYTAVDDAPHDGPTDTARVDAPAETAAEGHDAGADATPDHAA